MEPATAEFNYEHQWPGGAAPILRLAAPKLAVQGRYNQSLCLSVSSCSLQGIAERPLPCNYYAIRYDGALSRR